MRERDRDGSGRLREGASERERASGRERPHLTPKTEINTLLKECCEWCLPFLPSSQSHSLACDVTDGRAREREQKPTESEREKKERKT